MSRWILEEHIECITPTEATLTNVITVKRGDQYDGLEQVPSSGMRSRVEAVIDYNGLERKRAGEFRD